MNSITSMTVILVSAVCFIQAMYAGLNIISMLALRQGMSHYTFVVYRMAIATVLASPLAWYFERNTRPAMTFKIFAKIMLLSMFDPVMDQNLYYVGMKKSSATFTSALCNMLPVFGFLMAWICRLEKVNFKTARGAAKVLGTLVTVAGAILLTMVKGRSLNHQNHHQNHHQAHYSSQHTEGAVFLIIACFSWSCFMILQVNVLKSYPCKLSLTALICFCGMVEGAVVAMIIDSGSRSWSIQLDYKLLAAVYGGVLSAFSYFVMGVVAKKKGPVFYSAFNPLATLLVVILGSIFLAEQLYIGSVIGAVIIVGGLYLVLWGKAKDQPPSEPTGIPASDDPQV